MRSLSTVFGVVVLGSAAWGQNQAPVADAGPDQTILTVESTQFEGSATDPDGDLIVLWLWTEETTPPDAVYNLSDPNRPDPAFDASTPGEYVFSLTAFDGGLWSEPDSVTITVIEVLPVVAVADADVTSGPAPLTVQFDGSATTGTQGVELTYFWDFGDSPTSISAEATPTHTFMVEGEYDVILTVSDTLDQFDSVGFIINVGPYNSFCDDLDGSLASCPCSNPGSLHTGCDIKQATGGVSLSTLSQQTSPQNRVTWRGTGFPTTGTPAAILIRATGLDPAGPQIFGDGLTCIGPPLVCLGAAFAIGGTSIHTHGHGASVGSGQFYYQLWFRNQPAMYCDPTAAFNLSNGRILTW